MYPSALMRAQRMPQSLPTSIQRKGIAEQKRITARGYIISAIVRANRCKKLPQNRHSRFCGSFITSYARPRWV
jgi:hypothetical protein